MFGSSVGLKSIVKSKGGCDILIGGPPCQAYSIAGRVRDENGMQNDYRNYLFESYLKIVVGINKPKIIVFENVQGILSASQVENQLLKEFAKHSINQGFTFQMILEKALFNMADFGVPQES